MRILLALPIVVLAECLVENSVDAVAGNRLAVVGFAV